MKNVVKARLSLKELAFMLVIIFSVSGVMFYESDPFYGAVGFMIALMGCRTWCKDYWLLCTRCGSRVKADYYSHCGKCARIQRRVLKLEQLELDVPMHPNR